MEGDGSTGTGGSTQTGGSTGSGAAGAGGAAVNSSGTGGGTAAVDIGPWASCPPTDPAPMVALPDGYSIGRTEVTIAQYQAWLRTSPTPNLQIPDCSWKTSFVPRPTLYTGDDCNYQSDCCNYPVVHVDWCDAYAYCQSIGRRLCGKIGGGPNGWNDYANENSSQWYNACSSHGVNTYVYGNDYNPNTCNTEATEGGQTKVAAHLQCQSPVKGYQGVYDLTGNVREWEDSCDEASHYCRLRAGSSYGTATTGSVLTCAFESSAHLSFTLSDIGFRCCSSP